MSSGEVAVIAVLGGLCGVLVGAATAALVISQRRQSVAQRTRLIEAYTGWLAVRMTAGRASLSFVAAFRALAAERSDSIYFPLRTDEAQRARAYWCDAMQKLDLAEAALIVLHADDSGRDPCRQFFRVRPDALRRVINGDEADVDRLAQDLHAADRVAVDYVRNAVADAKRRPANAGIQGLFVKTFRQVRAIVDRWGEVQ
ncbi:MAG: hypothetical protein ACYTFA_12860 [Planctomycetota bacterium]|jgi:hypothetical protein